MRRLTRSYATALEWVAGAHASTRGVIITWVVAVDRTQHRIGHFSGVLPTAGKLSGGRRLIRIAAMQ